MKNTIVNLEFKKVVTKSKKKTFFQPTARHCPHGQSKLGRKHRFRPIARLRDRQHNRAPQLRQKDENERHSPDQASQKSSQHGEHPPSVSVRQERRSRQSCRHGLGHHFGRWQGKQDFAKGQSENRVELAV